MLTTDEKLLVNNKVELTRVRACKKINIFDNENIEHVIIRMLYNIFILLRTIHIKLCKFTFSEQKQVIR